MNAIVLIALKRPYTFVVLAILILIFGGRAALSTPTDIFPNVGIPVVAVVWTYGGLTPEDMSGRVAYYYERALTTTVGNIEHIESESLYGPQVQAVATQLTEVQIRLRHIQAAVSQIRALGGGWTLRDQPNGAQTLPFGPFGHNAARRSELELSTLLRFPPSLVLDIMAARPHRSAA